MWTESDGGEPSRPLARHKRARSRVESTGRQIRQGTTAGGVWVGDAQQSVRHRFGLVTMQGSPH